MSPTRRTKWLIGTAAVAVIGTALALSPSPRFTVDPVVRFIVKRQQPGIGNFTTPRQPERQTTNADGSRVWTNLRYPSTFPNNFLDLYSPDPKSTTARPTLIYVHGGGFIWGDKADGDPFAKSASSTPFVQVVSTHLGYNVVSINYAFAPQYRYPTPTRQLNEAIAFLQREQRRLGLDMTRVVLSGGSAGAHITSQYALLVTDPAYAKEVGIDPVLSKAHLKALYLQSPAFNPSNSAITDDRSVNLQFSLVAQAYLGSRRLATHPLAMQANVITNATAAFPPVFMSDGNTQTLNKATDEMAARLKALGVTYEYYSVPKSVAPLAHGFEASLDTPYAQAALQRATTFLQQHVPTAPAD